MTMGNAEMPIFTGTFDFRYSPMTSLSYGSGRGLLLSGWPGCGSRFIRARSLVQYQKASHSWASRCSPIAEG